MVITILELMWWSRGRKDGQWSRSRTYCHRLDVRSTFLYFKLSKWLIIVVINNPGALGYLFIILLLDFSLQLPIVWTSAIPSDEKRCLCQIHQIRFRCNSWFVSLCVLLRCAYHSLFTKTYASLSYPGPQRRNFPYKNKFSI